MSIYLPSLEYYVYAYLREDGTPYYVGKGKGRRAWSKNHRVGFPPPKERVFIMESNLTELGAFALERRLIRWYGRKDNGTGILRNMTDGGEGIAGWWKGRDRPEKRGKQTPEYIEKRVAPTRGMKRSVESRKRISDARKGMKFSNEHRDNIRSSRLGKTTKPHSEATKQKIAESVKRRHAERKIS